LNILGIGTDLIEVDRIKKVIEKYPAFLEKIFTYREVNYCNKKGPGRYQCFASRFAAKEAVAKSLGQGIGKNVFFKEIEIRNDSEGKPFVFFSGITLNYTINMKVNEVKLSISSTKKYCIAFAVSITD